MDGDPKTIETHLEESLNEFGSKGDDSNFGRTLKVLYDYKIP